MIAISIFLTTVLLMVIACCGYGLQWNHVNAPIFTEIMTVLFSGVSPTQLNELELRGEISEIGLRLPPVQCSRAKEICL